MSTMRRYGGSASGAMVWCNQLTPAHASYFDDMPDRFMNLYESVEDTPYHTTHTDGSQLSQEELDTNRSLLWKHARAHLWSPGDLLILDNQAVAHGRIGFPLGDKRNVVVGILQ